MKNLKSVLSIVIFVSLVLLMSCDKDSTSVSVSSTPLPLETQMTTPIYHNIPPQLQSGSVPLFASSDFPNSPDSSVDLDTGATWQSDSSVDIKFSVSQNMEGEYALQVTNNAISGLVSKNELGFTRCMQKVSELSHDPITDIEVGVNFCVLTNQRHLSQIKIEELHQLGQGSIRISFITWDISLEGLIQLTTTRFPTPLATHTPSGTKPYSTNPPDSGVLVHKTEVVKLLVNIENPDAPSSFFNLDTDDNINDFQYVISRGGGGEYFSFMLPINGTKSKVMGNVKPNYNDCLQATSSLKSVGMDNIPVGTYFCAISSHGRLAQLLIEEVNWEDGLVQLSFITWEGENR